MAIVSDKRQSARDRLINAAEILFYNNGITSTGIDSITERAGVAKQSLYNNFASKAELVNAYIEARHQEWLGLYELRLRTAKHPGDRVLAVFDAYQDHAEHNYERGFRGCGLLNAAAELIVGDPGRQAVKMHKEEVEALLMVHLGDIFPDDLARACRTARHLSFLLEGAIARAGLQGTSECVKEARQMAYNMLAGQ